MRLPWLRLPGPAVGSCGRARRRFRRSNEVINIMEMPTDPAPLPTLRSDRLVYRTFRLDDAAAALPIYSDPEVVRYLSGQTTDTAEDMRQQLVEVAERRASYPRGMGGWAMVLEAEIIGTALLKPLPDRDYRQTDDIEVGWHLRRDKWGQGLATEAGRRLLQYAAEELGLTTVYAVVDSPNTASMRVAERLGMTHVGQTDAYYGGRTVEFFRIQLSPVGPGVSGTS